MTITKISRREFDQDVGKARCAAAEGPVVITDRGEPTHVLLSIETYHRLIEGSATIVDLLADRRAAEIAFEVERTRDSSLPVFELPE